MVVYMDDMLVKSQRISQHEEHLEEIFRVIKDNGMMLNPTKCTFGLKAKKFLGYMVMQKGIELNQAKVAALISRTPPGNIREVQTLNGRIVAVSRFMSRSNIHFFKILRQKGIFEWLEEFQ